jgi:hypothetical protein
VVIQNGLMLPAEGDAAGREAPWIAPVVARTLAGRTLGFADVFRWNLGQLQGMCFTRRALARAGPFDPSFRILDDLDLVLRASLGGADGLPRRAGVRVPPPRRGDQPRSQHRARGGDPARRQARA